MLIKEASLDDITMLVEQVCLYKSGQDSHFEQDKKKISSLFVHSIVQENSSLFIANNKSGVILGYIIFHVIPIPLYGGTELYISDLLVSNDSRGSGTGTQLLQFAEQYARDNNCTRLMLNNLKSAESYKKAFYKKAGFTERDNVANFVKDL